MLAELKPVLVIIYIMYSCSSVYYSLPVSNKSSSTHPDLTHAVLEAP